MIFTCIGYWFQARIAGYGERGQRHCTLYLHNQRNPFPRIPAENRNPLNSSGLRLQKLSGPSNVRTPASHFSQHHRNFSKHKAADRSLRHKRRRAAEDRSKYPNHMVQTWPIWLTHYSSHWPEQLALAWCNNHIFIFYVSSVVGYHHPLSYLPHRSQHRYDLPFFL